jgi:hypothetical protein
MILNYDTDEGTVLSAINIALGGNWWEELSEDAQEKVHDALYSVMNTARQNKGSAEQQTDNTQSKQALREIAERLNEVSVVADNYAPGTMKVELQSIARQLLAL